MNIQIVNSSTGEVVATKRGLNLEASIPSYKTIRRRHPVARHRRKVLCTDLVAILSELRDETRFV